MSTDAPALDAAAAGVGFDIIGDVHGCFDELVELLARLGYGTTPGGLTAPPERRVVFVGDLVDRGPRIADTVRLAMDMVDAGTAHCVLGNHELQLLRHLRGEMPPLWGLAETMAELRRDPQLTERLRAFAADLPPWLRLDEDRLLVVHAGMTDALLERADSAAVWFALYACLPVQGTARTDWAADYRGARTVVYGHTPTKQPRWVNGAICIDTGCVYGGALTALRYPERELVAVPARRAYYKGG
ncbi:MAG: metallophosphoesterase [Planctomycetes bacterium]|nr:metallophosphoesterase [Planctomycetota bacterium]MCB9889711.1 metallophosphoesterase [Planctomycetota bacterium]